MSLEICPKCGFEIIPNANYCFNCGEALKDPVPEIVYLKKESPIEIVDEKLSNTEEQAVQQESETKEENVIVEQEESASAELANDEIEDDNVEQEEVEEELSQQSSTRKILWLPEWAFCTTLLVIGIVAIITYKFINDPEWNKYIPDMSAFVSQGQPAEAKDNSEELNNIADSTTNHAIDSLQKEQTTPLQQVQSDSAYHVVVMTLKSLESAQKIVANGKYANAYIISDSTLHRVAVYNNIDQAAAKRYLDSIANQDCPGAWIYHGKKK